MNKFFYGFMLAALALLLFFWFYDGRPLNEGYGWLFAFWTAILVGGYWYDHRKPNLNKRG